MLVCTAKVWGDPGSVNLIEEYRSPDQVTQLPTPVRDISPRAGSNLFFEEEYSSTTSFDPYSGPFEPSDIIRYRLPKIEGRQLLFYVGYFLLSLLVLFFVTDFSMRIRISRALARIPWEGVRSDPLVLRWPRQNLLKKRRIWKYLKDLPLIEQVTELRKQQSSYLRKQTGNEDLLQRYLVYLKKVRCAGEARFILGVLSVIGRPHAAGAILGLLKRFPGDRDIAESVATTLVNIRDIKLLTSILPFLPKADSVLFEIAVLVCRSFDKQGTDFIANDLMNQKNPGIRTAIIRILGEVGNVQSIPHLEQFLIQGTDKDRMEASRSLAMIGTEAVVSPLVEALCQNNSPLVRASICQRLTDIPRDPTLQQLVQVLEESPTFYFRVRAIEGLKALHPDTSDILRRALTDTHPKVQAAAAMALEKIGLVQKALDDYLADYNEELQTFLISVGKAGVIDPLLAALKHLETKPLKRTIRLIARTGNREAIPFLMGLLESTQDWTVRSRLIPALAQLNATEVVPQIIAHLRSKHHWVRKTSIDALGKLLSPDSSLREQTLPIFHEALNDVNPWTRASAVHVLTVLEDRTCNPEFIRLLKDPQTRVRAEAIRGLKSAFAVEAEADLIAMLDDPRQKVCALTASALGKFKSRKSLPKLFDKFEHAKPLFRLAILEAVYNIDPTEFDPLVSHLRTATRSNLKVVRELKERFSYKPSKILVTLARIGETGIRCLAVRNLSTMTNEVEVEDLLLSLLEDADPQVRIAAVNTIAMSQNPDMAKNLSQMLDDPERSVRLRALLALGLIKSPESLSLLRKALDDDDHEIRAHALLAMFHYAEPHFLEFFLTQFKKRKVQNLLKRMISNSKDPLISLLVERIPYSKQTELEILRDHTLKSLDTHLEQQILFGATKTEKLRAIMMAEILKRKHLIIPLRRAVLEDSSPEIRARALRAFAEVSDVAKEKELIQQAIQDPALEVQTIASRLLIHLGEKAG